MIFKNMELHNIAEANQTEGRSGFRLQRVPESVRMLLEEPARNKTLYPGGAEIRFFLQEEKARITLSSSGDVCLVRLFFGTFDSQLTWEIGPEPVTLTVELPENFRKKHELFPSHIRESLPFHPELCRIALFHGVVHIHSIEGEVRPPDRESTPARTMLSYGTSITHGSAATGFHLTYAAQTAWRLGVDLINLGVGGACRCERAFGEYMASRDDWDFATLSLSVNMIGAGFTLREFRDRTKYLIGKIAGAHPKKPVACISIFPYFGDWGDNLSELQPTAKARPEEFRRALEQVISELVSELDLSNLHYIKGPDVLTNIGGLTVDILHPADLAMILMGENLAKKLKPLVGV